MTATSHRIFNLSAGIALSFHWWVWLLFLLAASLPDQLEPATRRQLGLTILGYRHRL